VGAVGYIGLFDVDEDEPPLGELLGDLQPTLALPWVEIKAARTLLLYNMGVF
jgi:hypothetical protein